MLHLQTGAPKAHTFARKHTADAHTPSQQHGRSLGRCCHTRRYVFLHRHLWPGRQREIEVVVRVDVDREHFALELHREHHTTCHTSHHIAHTRTHTHTHTQYTYKHKQRLTFHGTQAAIITAQACGDVCISVCESVHKRNKYCLMYQYEMH